jgi:hypothetical protein
LPIVFLSLREKKCFERLRNFLRKKKIRRGHIEAYFFPFQSLLLLAIIGKDNCVCLIWWRCSRPHIYDPSISDKDSVGSYLNIIRQHEERRDDVELIEGIESNENAFRGSYVSTYVRT